MKYTHTDAAYMFDSKRNPSPWQEVHLWNLAIPKLLCKPKQITDSSQHDMHTIDTDRAVIADLANNNKDIRSMNMDIQKSQPQDSQSNGFVLKANFYCDTVYMILHMTPYD